MFRSFPLGLGSLPHHDGDEAAPNEKSGHGYTASQPTQARGCENQ